MKSSSNMPWRNKIAIQLGAPILAFVGIAFVVLMVLTLYSYTQDREEALKAPAYAAHSVTEDVSALLDQLELSIILAADSARIGRTDHDNRAFFMRSILRHDSSLFELKLLDRSLENVVRVVEPMARDLAVFDAVRESPYMMRTMEDGVLVKSPPRRSVYNTPYMLWYAPVHDDVGEIAGVMRATVDVSVLWEIVSRHTNTSPGETYIVDQEGAILVAVDSEHDETERAGGNAYGNKERHPQNGEVVLATARSGQTVALSAVPIPETSWRAVSEVPMRELLADAERNLMLLGLLTIVLFVLFLYELYVLRQSLLSTVAKFVAGVREFGAGNYKTRVRIGVNNELRILADAFNAMADNIDRESTEIVEKLQRIIKEQDTSTKMLVRREMELERANKRLLALGQAKSEFVSVVAHQLRTPLSAIKWTLRMALDGDVGKLSSEQRSFLMKGYESNERLIALVNDLLDVDRLETGAYTFTFTQTQLRDLAENVIFELHSHARENGIQLTLDEHGEPVPPAKIDQAKMRSVLQNLIENAIKYTPRGGSVTVTLRESNEYIMISITDTGIGIPKDQQKDIFSRFFRARNAVQHRTDGTGLGLYMSKRIVEKHGGKIWFESEEGKGTVVRFTIPLNS